MFFQLIFFYFSFKVWNFLFVLTRLASISLSVLTFWYGFAAGEASELVRLSALSGIVLLQGWMMWNFITFHLRRLREKANEIARRKKSQAEKQQKLKTDDDSEPSEVDQQNNKKANKVKVK